MARPEEQESRVVEPDFEIDTHIPSSPPEGRITDDAVEDGDGNRNHRGSDDTLSNHNLSPKEAQHDSLESCIGETQFELLERESQLLEGSPFQNATRPSQSTTASTRASTAAPELPSFTIERPKDLNIGDGTSGFKFGKPHKPLTLAQLGRHPGNTNTNASRPPSPAGPSKQNPLAQPQSKVQQTSPPSNFMINEVYPSPEHKRVPVDTTKKAGPLRNIQNPQPPTAKPRTEKDPEHIRQQVPRTVETMDSPMPKPAPLLESPAKEIQSYPQQLVPHTSVSKAATKSQKRSSMKQPFPEVVEMPSGRRMKSVPTPNRYLAAAAINSLRSVDINTAVPVPAPNNQIFRPDSINDIGDHENTSSPFHAITHASNSQNSQPPLSHNNPDKAYQARVRDSFNSVDGSGIQTGPMLPPAVDSHQIENQQDWAQILDQREQEIADHHRRDSSEVLPNGDAHTPHIDTGNLCNQVDSEQHHQFQPPSQSDSRPTSALSNTARLRMRPLVADDLLPQGISEAAVLHNKHPMKVQKSKVVQSHVGRGMKLPPQPFNQQPGPLAALSHFHDIVQYLPGIEEALCDYEDQKVRLESQQSEIKKLNLSTDESRKQIQRLEEEKVALIAKVKKFTEISVRYKAHMNDVVVAQKHLMAESSKIKAESAKIREESKAALQAYADRENQEEKLWSLIKSAKDLRPPIEKLEELEKENAKCKSEIENVEKTNELLQSELNARMVDLGRERHNTEQLQKSLNAQNEAHKELIETLKKAQSAIVDELTKEGSVLASIVNSENSVQKKINELSAFVTTVNNREPDLPPALIKLIEDLYDRIENKLQATEKQDVAINESSLKLFEDLKERIDQLQLGEDARASLNERISELRELNATLTANDSAKELECQGMAKRIDELGRELSGCRDQLTAKFDELAALRALPKEDPVLRGKIQDLENAKTTLHGQVNTANQEASRAKEDLILSREIAVNAQEQSQGLQHKLTEAQSMIKTLVEDKKKYLTNHKVEIDKARHEIAKSTNAAKTETKLKHDCLVKNLEQRRSEAEKELALAQEHLQKSQEERVRYTGNLNKLQEELSACRKQMAQQSAYIMHVDQRIPTQDEFERRESKLQQALTTMAELKAHFDTAQKETSQKVEDAVGHHQNEAEKFIKRLDAVEKENIFLEEQKSGVPKSLDIFKTNIDRGLGQSGILAAKQFVDEWASIPVHTPCQMGPPAIPMPKSSAAQRPSSASSDLLSLHTGMSDDEGFTRSTPGTPKDALRQNELKWGLTAQRNTSLQRGNAAEVRNSKSDVTPGTVQRLRATVTRGTIKSAITKSVIESSIHSPYHATPKPLRPAIRKLSGLSQPVEIEKPTDSSAKLGVETSTLDSLTGRADELSSMTTQTLRDMASTSAGLAHTSWSTQSNILAQSPRIENPTKSSLANPARNEEPYITAPAPTDMTPFSGAPLLASSSPSTSPVDQIAYDEQEFEKVHTETKFSKSGTSTDRGNGGRRAFVSMRVFAANTVANVKFKDTPASYQFSDDNDYSGVSGTRSIRPPALSATEESARRRQPQRLKSALRTSSKMQDTSRASDAQKDIFQIPIHNPIASNLQKTTPRTTTNRQQAPGRKGSIGSWYNRIVSGSKPDASSQASGAPSTVQKSSTARQIVSNVEKSPLMEAPKRNSRKRSASLSDIKLQPAKPFKQQRMSLPRNSRKESRTVIPDSQEDLPKL